MMIERRKLLASTLLAGPAVLGIQTAAGGSSGTVQNRLADLERRRGGRLGVAIVDCASTQMVARRGDERFPLCSTHKLLSVAYVLARVDRNQESLSRRVVYAREDLVPYSPVTGKHADGDGLTVGEICEAALTLSDNTAANLLLDSFGGPASLTAYLRSIGDSMTRLDRREPDLNQATPGDPRDTTTPIAMAATLHKTVLGDALSAASRAQLVAWLVANTTGSKQLRAAVPDSWRVGDKTGAGSHTTTNDVGVLWPPSRAPIIVAAYYTGARASGDECKATLAEVGRLAATV